MLLGQAHRGGRPYERGVRGNAGVSLSRRGRRGEISDVEGWDGGEEGLVNLFAAGFLGGGGRRGVWCVTTFDISRALKNLYRILPCVS